MSNLVKDRQTCIIVGKNTKKLRLERNWTQEELAARAEVSVSTISQIENLQKGWSSQTMESIARAFGVEPYSLFQRQYNNKELEALKLQAKLFERKPEAVTALIAFMKTYLEEEES